MCEDEPHYAGIAKCRMCGSICCIVIPVQTDLPDTHSNMECPQCNHMTCEFIDDNEEELIE